MTQNSRLSLTVSLQVKASSLGVSKSLVILFGRPISSSHRRRFAGEQLDLGLLFSILSFGGWHSSSAGTCEYSGACLFQSAEIRTGITPPFWYKRLITIGRNAMAKKAV